MQIRVLPTRSLATSPASSNTRTCFRIPVRETGGRRWIVLEDPFVSNGVFVLDEIPDWTIFVDELSGTG